MKQDEMVKSVTEYATAGFPGSYSYAGYRRLIKDLLAQGKSTAADLTKYPIEISRLNDHRMDKWDKHIQLREDILAELKRIQGPYTWLIITEGWCGDSAQTLPVIARMAAFSGKIDLRLVLRDQMLWLMDQYLTNGSRSIPLLICLDADGKEVFHWGSRPEAIQREFTEWKESGDPALTPEKRKEKLHLRYAQDRGNALQDDFLSLLKKMS